MKTLKENKLLLAALIVLALGTPLTVATYPWIVAALWLVWAVVAVVAVSRSHP